MIKTTAVKNIYICMPLSSSSGCYWPATGAFATLSSLLNVDMHLLTGSHRLKGKDSTRMKARLPESILAPKCRLDFLSKRYWFSTFNIKSRV